MVLSRRATLFSIGALAVGCSDPRPEPSAGSSRAQSMVKPILYAVPPAWTETESSPTSARRAGYRVPRVGNDKEDGEMFFIVSLLISRSAGSCYFGSSFSSLI